MPEPNLIIGDEGNNAITGTTQDDIIRGLGGNDTLDGVAGNDTVDGGEGTNTLNGGEGNDDLVNNFGNANGGVGNDTLSVDYTSYGTRVNNTQVSDYRFYAPDISASLLFNSNFEQFNFTGTAFNDTLQGFGNDDTLVGGAGNDALYGSGGKDSVQGGIGNDTIYGGNIGDTLDGGEGNDYLADFNAASETENITVNSTSSNNVSVGETQVTNFEALGNITTGSGNDTFKFADYTLGGNFNGSGGKDNLITNYSGYGQAIKTNSSTLSNAVNGTSLLQYSNIEQFNLTATNFNDTIDGLGNVGNTLDGGAGNDYLANFNAANQTEDITIDFTSSNNVEFGDTKIANFERVGNVTTGSGKDLFKLGAYTSGGTVNGGVGNDTLSVDYTSYGTRVNNTQVSDYRFYAPDISASLLFNSNFEQFNFTGTAFNDTLQGFGNDDTLVGGAGNDALYGSGGKDSVQGGIGNDTIYGGNIGDTLDGGEGNDYLLGESGNDTINGGVGNDTVNGGTDEDNIAGGVGNDYLLGESGNDTINGGAGNDYIDSGAGNDSIIGGVGNDTFAGVNSGDTIDGGEGIDFLQTFNASDATVDLSIDSNNLANLNYDNISIANIESIGNVTTGSGNDTFIYNSASSTSGSSVNGNLGNDTLSVDFSGYQGAVGNTRTNSIFELNNNSTDLLAYSNIEQLNITGTNFNDSLLGGNGNDTIDGGSGNDFLLGQAGNDTIDGGSGNDYIDSGTGNDSVIGGAGNDTIDGVNSGDIIDGGEGNDSLQSLNASDAKIDININSDNPIDLVYGSTSIVTSITNIESIGNLTTGSGNDNIVYDSVDSVAGKSINANGGNDTLSVDFSAYQGAVGNTRYGSRFEVNNNGATLLNYYNIEQLNITGSDFNDSLLGGTGSDTIAAGEGNDYIVGSTGNDTIDGGEGNDYIDSGTGNDSVIGGVGNDTFAVGNTGDTVDGGEGNDTIQTFDASNATVDLSINSDNPIDLNYGNTKIANIESIGNLTTGSGNDSIVYDTADSVAGKSINANGGNDTLSVDFSAYQGAVGNTRYGSRFEVNNNGATLLNYYNIEQLNITGSDFNDSLLGGTGSDTIAAGEGNDSLLGGTGNDTIDGGEGNDYIDSGTGNDSVIGGVGNDTFAVGNTGDTVDGGEGNDTIQTFDASNATVDLSINSDNPIDLNYGNTKIANIESIGNLTTGNGNDSIVYDTADSVAGKSINANGGNDTLSVDFSAYQGAVGNTRYGSRFEVNNNGATLLNYYNIEQLNITGSDFNDSLLGGTGSDTIAAGEGNDYIVGSTGNDTIDGGEGNDYIDSGTGNDSVIGGVGNDTFAVGNTGDTVDGGEGNDTIQTFDASNATVDLSINSDNPIDLNYGNTKIANIESIGNLTTGSGNDSIVYDTADSVAGKSINANGGNDTLSVDFSAYQGAVGNTRYGSRFEVNNNGATLLNYYNIEQLNITGSDFNDSLLGGTGSDTIAAGEGNDSLLGGTGNDTIDGGEGNDYIDSGTGNDSVIGGVGNDTFAVGNTGDTVDGGEGNDTIQTFDASNATVDLSINSDNPIDLNYGNTKIANIESIGNLTTGNGNDSIVYDTADSVAGKSINANGGNDTLSVDFSAYQGAVGNTRYGSRFEVNNNGATLLNYYNIEQLNITGSDFNDSLLGGTGSDTIAAGEGNDYIVGSTGNDTIDGGEGNDYIDSGTGNDTLSGGSGDDTLTGGRGKDSFVFNNPNEGIDTITDFSVSDDLLVFSAAGFGSDLEAGSVSSQMFTIDTVATSNEHRFIYDAGSGDLFYDSDGVGANEQIKIAGLGTNLSLTHNNFNVEL